MGKRIKKTIRHVLVKPEQLTSFKIGQTVYLRTDPDQFPRVVTGITQRQYGILYELSFGTETWLHNDFEISDEQDIML